MKHRGPKRKRHLQQFNPLVRFHNVSSSLSVALYNLLLSDSMADDFQQTENVFKEAEAKGFNPALIVLLVIGGLVLTFLIGNYALYMYAQKTLPAKKKKPVSKKKMKRERLKQGVSAPGE